MPKPPASPPSSDLTGVHRDRKPTDEEGGSGGPGEREQRTHDSPGSPGPLDAGEGRGKH